MANSDIGQCDCPVCKMSGAHVRKTTKGKAYILCDDCGCQIFARSVVSDKIMLGWVGLVPTPDKKIAPPPAAMVVKATLHDADGNVEAVEVVAPGIVPAADNDGDEQTIFDMLGKLGKVLG